MQFRIWRDNHDQTLKFAGEIPADVFVSLDLDRRDFGLLREVSKGSKRGMSAADHLLALEMLFRRHAEQTTEPS